MNNFSNWIAVASFVISLVAVLFSYFSLRTQVSISKNTAFFTQKMTTESLILKHEELLQLHGVDEGKLKKYGVSSEELIYLIQSFSAAELYYQISKKTKAEDLSEYRKNLLKHPKVRIIWNEFIKGHFLSESDFTRAIDTFIRSQYNTRH
ncbi:MAG: hypothetical protein H6R05_1402 [Burkholderiaceae bacterium]|nr:hypothetical protein [Burkholderiaceae bacterium]